MQSAPVPRPLALLAGGAAAGTVLGRELGLCAQVAALLLFAGSRVLLPGRARVGAALLGLCLGALAPGLRWSPRDDPSPAEPPDREGVVRVSDAIVEPGLRWDPHGREWAGTVRSGRGRFRLRWLEPPAPALPGDSLRGLAAFRPPPPPLEARGAEALRRDADRRIAGSLTARGTSLVVAAREASPRRWSEAARLALQEGILRWCGNDVGPLVCRLTLGTGPHLAPAHVRDHRVTGLAHILAVSGMNAALIAMLLRRCLTPLPARVRAWTTAAALLFYAAITGFEPPVVRAVGGCLLYDFAQRKGRLFDPPSAMGLTALATSFLAPDDMGSLSFLLSYAAVTGMWLFTPPLLKLVPKAAPWPVRAYLAGVAVSLAAFLATSPLTLWCFHQAGPWSVCATPILAPLVLALLVGGLVLGLATCISPAAGPALAWPIEVVGQLYLDGVGTFASLPAAPLHATTPPGSAAPWIAAVAAAAILAARPTARAAALACVLASAAHFLPAAFPGSPPPPAARITLTPVGHGLACLLVTPAGRTILVDCGSLDRAAPAERIVVPALRRAGLARLDDLVVTHGDLDHAGDVATLLANLPVTTVWIPEGQHLAEVVSEARRRGTTLRVVRSAETVRLDPGLVLFSPSLRPGEATANDRALALRGRIGTLSFVLLSDHQEPGLGDLLRRDTLPRSDLLLAPHHGRSCGLTPELLARVQPALVLVSDGSRFGPAAEEPRYRASGAMCLRTSECGEITVRIEGQRPVVETFRPWGVGRAGVRRL